MRLAIFATALLSTAAAAQTTAYPAQPVKVVVGFAAGGPSDIVARAMADHLGKALSQTVIVENKAGANAVLVVGPAFPVKTLAEFLQRVKARPGSATYASPGQGSSPHLATEQFLKLTGTGMVHVPYKGAAPAVTDLIGGQVDLSFATLGSVLPHLKSGKLTALAGAGLEPASTCGEAFGAQIAREIESNTRMARELNLKAD